jgi:hypothetical protein
MANEQAPAGKVFMCGACGKLSRWRYGFDNSNQNSDPQGRPYASHGWDESCMMNSALIEATEIEPEKIERLAPPV